MTQRRIILVLCFLLVLTFSLAAYLQPRAEELIGRSQTDDILRIVLGDGRKMFANHFFVKADVYFHRGYYPSFLDQSYSQKKADIHIAERHDGAPEDPAEAEHERTSDFLGKPKNWIDAFGRNFFPSRHSHRDKPGEAREILPWLRLSADLDPHHVETYTVGAYWLISNMGKVDEAESFLREGLRANPDSYEILFDLGKLYDEHRHDPDRARNLWELALRRWNEQEQVGENPDEVMYDAILAHLAHLEETKGNLQEALDYLDMELDYTPVLSTVQKHIAELKAQIAAGKK